MKLSDGGININDEIIKKNIERYVEKTEGYTFDFVKELIQGIYIDGISEEAVFERLNDLIKKDGKVKVSEDKDGKIGFSCKDEEFGAPATLGTPINESKQIRGFG